MLDVAQMPGEEMAWFVIYRELYGDSRCCARSLSTFQGTVKDGLGNDVPRFVLLTAFLPEVESKP